MDSYIELLELAGARFAVFDLGRSCVELSKKTFEDVVSRRKPYPTPFMQKAMLLVVSEVGERKVAVEHFNFDAICLPLDKTQHVISGSMEAYTAAMVSERIGGLVKWMGNDLGSPGGSRSRFSWMPTWGEAFMAQAHFARKTEGKSASPRVRAAESGLLSGKVGFEVEEGFSWSGDIGVPELGLAELIVRTKDEDRFARALVTGIKEASITLLGSLCEFMTHADLPRSVIGAIEQRTKALMVSVKPGDAIYAQLLQSMAGCKAYDAMAPVVNAILDHKVGGNAEILTRMVRYHREFMAEHDAFEIDKVLEPASRNPSGMDVFFAYVLDMIRVRRLHERIMLHDFGVLSPGVKARLRETMSP